MVDLCKAFDKMNHYALFRTLLHRKCSVQLINIFVHWFNISVTVLSGRYVLRLLQTATAARQGVVLSVNLLQ